VAFSLKQASLDSVHEKNMRHGHISTLLQDKFSPMPCTFVNVNYSS